MRFNIQPVLGMRTLSTWIMFFAYAKVLFFYGYTIEGLKLADRIIKNNIGIFFHQPNIELILIKIKKKQSNLKAVNRDMHNII